MKFIRGMKVVCLVDSSRWLVLPQECPGGLPEKDKVYVIEHIFEGLLETGLSFTGNITYINFHEKNVSGFSSNYFKPLEEVQKKNKEIEIENKLRYSNPS